MAVLGNCQSGHVTRCLQALLGGDWPMNELITLDVVEQMADGRRDLTDWFENHDKVFLQPWIWNALKARYGHMQQKVVLYPSVTFLAFHPDLVYVATARDGAVFVGPCGHYHSSLAFFAWKSGLSATDALKLYNRDIYQRLGFFDFWQSSCDTLRAEGQACGLALDSLLDRWILQGCFMHSINHPKVFVVFEIVAHLLQQLGIATLLDSAPYVRDYLADSHVWPVYPEIGERLGIPGSYRFKLSAPGMRPDEPVRLLDLENFILQSYAAYSRYAPLELVCGELQDSRYRQLGLHLGIDDSQERVTSSGDVAMSFQQSPVLEERDRGTGNVSDHAWLDEARQLFKTASA